MVYGLEGRWHTVECLQKRGLPAPSWPAELKNPAPCGTNLTLGLVWEYAGKKEEIRTCPANVADLGLVPFLNLYGAWESGFLWTSGGIAQQPAIYVHAMNLIAAEIQKIEREKYQENRKGKPEAPRVPKRIMRKLR
ncbi:MAG: hypothetical protein N2507_03265 [Candidatus Bipolaricaulota bacterium]|nr:hypothetical protein [Candidatus Bipolaricaulota bacterium]